MPTTLIDPSALATIGARRPLVDVAQTVGAEFAAVHGADVDRHARFPSEAIEALRRERALGALIPISLGGRGASLREVAIVGETLARSCASTAMVYAMHQIQVNCIVRHGRTPFLLEVLADAAAHERLFASATTEAGVGGAVRASVCAVDPIPDQPQRFRIEKQASVISYGEYAHAILATARRAPESAAGDQSLVYVPRDKTTLELTSEWDTFGFRGTCSNGFVLRAEGDRHQILPDAYADISTQTMLPTSHVVWSHLWLGLATEAVSRARAYLRAQARKTLGTRPTSAVAVAALVARLAEMRELVHGAARDYELIADDPEQLNRIGFAIRANNLKISASNMVVEIVTEAMSAIGMSAYREDSPYSIGRLLRDAHGAKAMIHNDRILGANAQWLLVAKEEL